MSWKTKIIKGIVSIVVPKEVVDFGTKIGNDMYEQQKSLIRIPDLKDVHIDEALRILKDELHLIPTKILASPNVAYADENENRVVLTKPRFGSRVNASTTIKVYYLTQDVIDASKVLLGNVVHVFKVPSVVGLNVFDAREDLESLGLKVTHKKDHSKAYYANKEDGQVTRLTYANGQNVGGKLKTGDRVMIYYVDEETIFESKALRAIRKKTNQERMSKFSNVTHNVTKGISTKALKAKKILSKNLGSKFRKKKIKSKEQKSDE